MSAVALVSTRDEWGAVTRALHWLIALLVVVLATVGWYMKGLPNTPDKAAIYGLHKSTGLTVLALMLARILWRAFEGVRPAQPTGMPGWQVHAARASHVLLYVALIAMPISGWLFNSAANFPLHWFGVFAVPALSGPDPELKAAARFAHEFLFWCIAGLVAVHASAALYHHFGARDDVLRRMGWGGGAN